MSLVVFGASYKTVSLEELGRVSIPKEETGAVARRLVACEGVNGALVLSTCNRVELYVDATAESQGAEACRDFLQSRGAREGDGYYLEQGEAVARHLFNVACSLDSQVLGETQILGQVKAAFMEAAEAGTCTETITRLFKDALEVGKRVRSETSIGRDSVSFSTAAIKAAAREFDNLADCRVLFVGSGEMAELALTYLVEAGVSDFVVTSRTQEHAQSFARRCKGQAVPFEQRYEALATADVVFSTTSASETVVQADPLDRARRSQGACGRKLVIIDEAVPCDVQVECASLEGVVLFNLESLGNIVDEGVAARSGAIDEAERMVSQAEQKFHSWMKQRSVAPTISALYAKGSMTVENEFARAVKSLEAQRGGCALSPDEREVLQAYGTAVMKKILHGPTARLRREAQGAASDYYTDAVRFLFGLDSNPSGSSPHAHSGTSCSQGKAQGKGSMA